QVRASRSDMTTRSVARRVRPKAESILHDPPIQKKRLWALFSYPHHRNLNPLLSRFNMTPTIIPLFSERLYVLLRLLIRCELRG
ncbi:hypothetical protein, partial [Serratia bockelmannii]|uniref:hypothetical protein n=1 Tax=Serratia bockelmannii TaxID=2703793 RepID=UPI0038C9BF74